MIHTKPLNLRVDADLKAQAEAIFSELGISTSTAINMFLRSVIRSGGISLDLHLSPKQLETLRAMDDVNHNRNLSQSFNSVDELMEELNA